MPRLFNSSRHIFARNLAIAALALSMLTGTIAFSGSAGAATTLTVLPVSVVILQQNSSTFATTLDPTGFTGSPTFSYAVTAPNASLSVNTATGVITSTGSLALGSYTISGTVSDSNLDTGAWTFTLQVNAPSIITTPTVARTITTGSLDQQIFTDGTYVWVPNLTGGSVTQILQSSGAVLHTIDFTATTPGYAPSGIASNGIYVWVTNFNGSTVDRFSIAQVNQQSSVNFPSTNLTLLTTNTNTTVPPVANAEPSDITYHGSFVWVTTQGGQALLQIDATTGAVLQTISTAGALSSPRGVSSDGTDVWVANPGLAFGGNNNNCSTASGATQWNNTISELNATTGALVASIPVGNAYVAGVTSGSQPFDISADGTNTWVTLKCQNAVAKVNSSTGAVVGYTSLPAGALPQGIVADGTDVWVAESGLAQVQEILASTGAIIGTFALPAGAAPWGVSYDGTHVWISNFTGASVSEIVSTPELIPTTLPQGQVGIPYSQTLTAIGGAPGSYTITCVGTPPPGITVTPTATGVNVFGTPTMGGVFLNAVNCTVSDMTGVYSTDVVPLTVTPLPIGATPLAPTVTTSPPTAITATGATLNGVVNPNGTGVSSENFCYIAGITLVRCNGATIVPIVPATLPSSSTPTNLSAMVTGLITGSPYCYQIEATNSVGTSFSTPVCFASEGAGPVITTLLLPNAIQNFPYVTPIATVGGTSPLVFSASGLPAGLSISATTGIIKGTATKLGTYRVTVKVVDAKGLSDSRVYSLKVVVPVNLLPQKLRYITHFGENLSSLTAVDITTIHQVATFLATHKQLNVSLIGFTDPLNTAAYNLLLGQRRALSVAVELRADLKKLHIKYVVTTTASKGERLPVTPGLSNAARATDRRVTIFVF